MKRPSSVALLGAMLLLLLTPTPLSAERSVWQRVKSPIKIEEREILDATERILRGSGDERDMLRARSALVSLSRGTLRSPSLILLLIRLRRELGLSPSRNCEELLTKIDNEGLAPLLRSEVHWEWAHLRLFEQRDQEADERLGRALSFAWEKEARLRILALRGWQRLAHEDFRAARQDFQLAVRLTGSRKTEVQVRSGLALTFALQGYERELNLWSSEAFRAQLSRASVSGAEVFGDLALARPLRRAGALILRWGSAQVLRGSDSEGARSLEIDICQELAHPDVSGTLASLRDAWSRRCAALTQTLAPPDGL